MKTAVAENKSKKQLDHKSEKIKAETQKFENEMKDAEKSEEKPGIFKRFFSWAKSIFSSSDEPNLAPEAASRGNARVSSDAALQERVNNTLSASETSPEAGSGTGSPEISGGISEQAAGSSAPNSGEASPPKNEMIKEDGETGEKAPERKTVSIKNMTFEVFEQSGYIFSESGTLKALGQTVRWTSKEKINLQEQDGSYFGSGAISIASEKLTAADGSELRSEVLIQNSEAHHLIRGALCYHQDEFKINILEKSASKEGREFTDLDTIKTGEISFLNYSNTEENSMTGDVTINGSGFEGSAEGDILWFPRFLFKGAEDASKLKFGKDGGKLGFTLGTKDLSVSLGITNAAELTGAKPVTIGVDEDGKITYHLPKEYNVNILNGLYEKENLQLAPIDLTMDKKISELKVSDIDFSVGGAQTEGFAIGISMEEDKRSVSASMEKLTYKGLTIEKPSGGIDGQGMTLGADNFEFEIGGKKLTGKVEELKWKPAATTFSVKKFELSASDLAFGENVTVEETSVNFSLTEGKFSFGASGKFSKIEFSLGCVSVSSEELEVGLSFAQGEEKADKDGGENADNGGKGEKSEEKKDEKTGLSATIKGSVNIKVGGDPLIDTTVDKFSYEDGEFGIEDLSVKTTFDKLISEKFSGSAVVSTQNLKFSDKVEMDSLKLGIEDLAYNGNTLINSGTAAIIFREDKSEEPAKLDDDAKLKVGEGSGKGEGESSDGGEKSGILQNASISIYLLENKKGAELEADAAAYEFSYLKINFTKLKGEFFTKGGENGISADSAELKAGDKLNKILGVEDLALTADNCKISSEGIELGSVSVSASSLTIANALKLSDIKTDMEFGEEMALKSFHIHSSAELGKFSVTGLDLTVSDDGGKTSAALEAQKIDCGGALKNLEITDVKGGYSESGVTVEKAAFGFKIAGTVISGSVKNLTWSSENDFSVEQMEIDAGEYEINGDFKLNSAKITASVKNSEFSFGANASFHVSAIDKGVIKIDETDLEFAFDVSKQKGESGENGGGNGDKDASKLSFTASADGKIKVTIGDGIAAAELGDIKYADGEFSAGGFTAQTDLSKFAGGSLGGSAGFSVKDLKFKKGEKPTVGSMGLTVSGVTYNEKTLMNDLSVDIFLDGKSGSTAEEKTAEMALEDDLDGELTGLKVEVHLTDTFRGVKMKAEKFAVNPGNFSFEFGKFDGEIGTSSGNKVFSVKLGEASVKSDLSKSNIAKYIGIENLEFTAEDVSIEKNKLKVGKVSASAETDIALGSLTLTKASVTAEFNDKNSLESLKLACGVKYKDIAEGSATVIVSEDGVTLDEIKDFSVTYGCFKGKLDGIEKDKTGDNVIFKDLSLAKVSQAASEDEFEEKEKGTLVSKFLKTVPDIKITISQLKIENGELKKPSLDDITISKFSKDFKLCEAVKGKLGYEDGRFEIGVHSGFSVPKDEDVKKITFLDLPLYGVPPFLEIGFSLGMKAGVKADIGLTASAAKNDKALNFNSQIEGNAHGTFGFFGEAGITVNAIVVKLKAGVELFLTLDTDEVKLTGSFGLSYDPEAESFFEAFTVEKEKTALEFSLNSSLNFGMKLNAGISGLPVIFSDKKLTHSWDLFNYKLLGVDIKGGITYDKEAGKYKFSADPTVTKPGGLDAYKPTSVQDKLDDLGTSLDELQNGMKKINSLLNKAQLGADPEKKGSTGEVEGDLGGEIQAAKDKLMPELKKRIDDTFKKSKDKSIECHMVMVNLSKIIEKNADKMAENERNVKEVEKIMGQSSEAMDIIGYKSGEDGLTAEKYGELLKNLEELKNDEEKLNKLARLEPAAVVNMFKAFAEDSNSNDKLFKYYGTFGAAEIRTSDDTLMEFGSKIDTGIYGTAMNELENLLKKRQADVEKQENILAAAKKALENAEKEQRAFELHHERIIKELNAKITAEEAVYQPKAAAAQAACEKDLAAIDKDGAKRMKALERENEKKKREAERKQKAENSRLNDSFLTIIFGNKVKEGHFALYRRLESTRIWLSGFDPNPTDEKLESYDPELRERVLNGRAQVKQCEKDLDDYDEASQKYTFAAKQEAEASVRALEAEIDREKEQRQQALTEELQLISMDLRMHRMNLAAEEDFYKNHSLYEKQRVESAKAILEEAETAEAFSKQKLEQAGDISTAMTGFSGFITAEHEHTVKAVESARKKYKPVESVKLPPEPTDEMLKKRREVITLIIDRVIKDKTDDQDKLKQFGKKAETVQSKSNIIDKNMRGAGFSRIRNSVNVFGVMKADNEKFQKMQKQLDSVYGQLNGFHDVMRQVLVSWNAVNGLDFTKKNTAAALNEGTEQVVDLIGEIDNVEKKAISDETVSKLTEEVKRLNGSKEPQADEPAAQGSELDSDLVRLGIE